MRPLFYPFDFNTAKQIYAKNRCMLSDTYSTICFVASVNIFLNMKNCKDMIKIFAQSFVAQTENILNGFVFCPRSGIYMIVCFEA